MDIKDQIIEANKAYRLGQPIMTDQEFDALVEKFQSQVSEEEFDEFRKSFFEKWNKKVNGAWPISRLSKFNKG